MDSTVGHITNSGKHLSRKCSCLALSTNVSRETMLLLCYLTTIKEQIWLENRCFQLWGCHGFSKKWLEFIFGNPWQPIQMVWSGLKETGVCYRIGSSTKQLDNYRLFHVAKCKIICSVHPIYKSKYRKFKHIAKTLIVLLNKTMLAVTKSHPCSDPSQH